ncbi:hypothetical protein D9M71_566200 [compost metagenome]
MIFNEWTYNQFYMERTSWSAEQKAPIHFTKEEIEWAIEQTEYKYFGSYEFSDQQQIAMEIILWKVKESLKDKPVVLEYEKYEGRDIGDLK